MQEQLTKILAVDDNPVARAVLQAFLKKSGYEPVIVEDAEAALRTMTGPEAPNIAILDWMMPGMSGTELCAKLRSSTLPLRPYIIMLTSRTTKADIAEGLDAGADEFLGKPFNQVEMLARLRAAQRMVSYEKELQQRIDELESMVERHRLLGDMIAQSKEQAAKEQETNPSAEGSVEAPAPDISDKEVEAAIRQAFTNLGWNEVEVRPEFREGPYDQAPLTAWAGFHVDPAQTWLDFLLECDVSTGNTLFEKSMRRRPLNDKVLLDFMGEILTLVAADAKAELEARGGLVVAPFLSRGIRLGSLGNVLPVSSEKRECFAISTMGLQLHLTLIRRASPKRQKTAGQLNHGDILAEPFLPSEAYQIPLLNRGTLINERYIDRLISLAQAEGKPLRLSTIEASPLAAHFNPARKGRTIASLEDE